jgi:hypothetical protein
MLTNDPLNVTEFDQLESAGPRQSDRGQPILGFPTFFANMNVRRLIQISLIEPELVTFDS